MKKLKDGVQKKGRSVALAIIAAGVCSVVFGSAYANFASWTGTVGTDPLYPSDIPGVYKDNNGIHNVLRRALTTTYTNGVIAAIADFDSTDLDSNSAAASECTDPGHDVCVYDYNFGANNLNGWNNCRGTVSGSDPNATCSLNRTNINTYYNPPAQHIACHELAHTIGLRHTSTAGSCLTNGATTTTLSAHDRSHINGYY